MKRSTIIAIAVVLAVIILAVNATRLRAPTQDIPETGSITVTGTLACLPKKGDGPQTVECAYGLRAIGDIYYGLSMTSGDLFDYQTGQSLQVKGLFTPPESNTSYDIIGTIEVSSIEPL